MTRPMTGQPKTDEELTNAVQEANKNMTDDVPEDIKNHPLTKESLKDGEGDEKSEEEKLKELRAAKERGEFDELEQIAEENEQATSDEYDMVRNKNEDNTGMHVAEDNETQTFTREEWESRRDTRTRTWDRLERNGGMYVRVAHWFTDADVNKVTTGNGFFGHKVGESKKALKFEVNPSNENHNAEVETVWVPKKAVRTHELK